MTIFATTVQTRAAPGGSPEAAGGAPEGDRRGSGGARHRVAVLALPAVVPLDLRIPAPVFGAYAESPDALTLCAERPGPVATSAGLAVVAGAGLEALADADT